MDKIEALRVLQAARTVARAALDAVRETVTQGTCKNPAPLEQSRAKASGWHAGLMTRNTNAR